MDITIAYFHPLLHPDVVKQDFDQIRATGAGSILYAIHEQEEQRFQRDLERGLRQAQDAGLKVNVSLGRHGNLFAGPLFVPSWYTFRHPQSRVMDRHGRYHDISCFNHQSFRSWLFKEIEHYLTSYPINVKRVDSNIKTTIALLPQDMSQVEDIATIPQLDTIGCHLFWNMLNEDVTVVEQWGRNVIEIAHQQGKRSQIWLQNFNLDEDSEKQLDSAFDKILSVEPDELGCYYFWRNNANPTQVWRMTQAYLRRIPRRQLYWQVNSPGQPGAIASS